MTEIRLLVSVLGHFVSSCFDGLKGVSRRRRSFFMLDRVGERCDEVEGLGQLCRDSEHVRRFPKSYHEVCTFARVDSITDATIC